MTQKLFNELQHSSLAELVEHMDTIEWYRFSKSLTEAAGTESHLTLGRLSCTNLLRAGTRILEGWDLHRAGPHEAEDAARQADMNEERRESDEVSGTHSGG